MQKRSAFTLVELSIVLVILGLLVGGVLAGQSLIRAAELRAISTEKDQLTTAFNSFREKYMAIPGDMTNAFAFWGTAGIAGCAADTTAVDGGCNGDGNGIISSSGGGDADTEFVKGAMHLALAGLVEGNYDGMGSTMAITNMIKSKFPSAAWVFEDANLVDAGGVQTGTARVYLSLMDPTHAPLSTMSTGDAWTVDTKIDDGKANTGSLRGSEDDCEDQDTDGNAANGNEDFYSLVAVGPDYIGDCTFTFIIIK